MTGLGASPASWKHLLLVLFAAGSFLPVLLSDPIPQSHAYHAFADSRTLFSIPNGFDVTSNLAFLVAGVLGLWACSRSKWGEPSSRIAWITTFIGIALVSVGSAVYHWSPGNRLLVWDRLPMTVAFMGLFVALLGEHVSVRLVAPLLPLALIAGLGSVVYWHQTDDLRFYLWVQMMPLLSIPVLLTLFPSPRRPAWPLVSALGFYVLAKIAEGNDLRIWELTGGVSGGHTIKHLLAATGCYLLVHMLGSERRIPS